jgi:hypothetical protein
MENIDVAPINHNALTATSSVALGAAGGAAKTGITWGAVTFGLLTVSGIILGALSGGLLPAIGLGLVGGFGGLLVGPFVGAIASAFGGFSGAVKSANRVTQEKGAANVIQAQVAAYQAQGMAESKYNFPEQGSVMNPAGITSLSAAQVEGRVNGQQLQRA